MTWPKSFGSDQNSSHTEHKGIRMKKEGTLRLIESNKHQIQLVGSLIKKQASDRGPLHILEAGCGRRWPYNLDGIEYVLTGVDMDSAALDIRKNTVSDLDEAIEGDLCSVDLGTEQYDVIYCSYVLEHVETADVVVKKFIKWIKPGGIIIILIPDPHSVQGFITRMTPHWFHVFYYRFMVGNKNAGKPGYPPYPTFYHSIVSRNGLRDFCNDESNNVVLAEEYGIGYMRPGRGLMKTMLQVFKRIINLVSLGSLSVKHTNCLYVLRKQNV